MNCRNILRFLAITALLAFRIPASAQTGGCEGCPEVDGYIDLTYDAPSMTLYIYGYTEADAGMADWYQVIISVHIFRDGILDVWDYIALPLSTDVEVDQTIDAYPGVTYTATATHTLEWIDDQDEPGYYLDPWGFTLTPFLDSQTNNAQVYSSGPYAGRTATKRRDVARTHANPAQTPPSELNITSNGTVVVQGGTSADASRCPAVDPTNGAPNPNGTQLVCVFFGSTPGPESGPQVPDIRASLSGVNSNLTVSWGASLNYSRPDSGVYKGKPNSCSRLNNGIPQPYSDSAYGSGEALSGSVSFDITANLGLTTVVQGGVATLQWGIGGVLAQQKYQFGIWGSDPPSPNDVRNLVTQDPRTPWYALYIVKHESGYGQFVSGLPKFGPPCGFGAMQLDPPRSVSDVWNWQTNVKDGINVMVAARNKGQQAWDDFTRSWKSDTSTNKTPPCNKTVGSTTFCFNYDNVTTRSFADANGIKFYNGCATEPYIEYKPGASPPYVYHTSCQDIPNTSYVAVVLNTPIP